MIEGIRNLNTCINKLETWSWKYGVGIKEGIMGNPLKESRGEMSHQSGSCRSRERSTYFAKQLSVTPERRRHHSATMDAMSRALRRTAQSLFSDEIECVQMPR